MYDRGDTRKDDPEGRQWGTNLNIFGGAVGMSSVFATKNAETLLPLTLDNLVESFRYRGELQVYCGTSFIIELLC